MKELLLQSIALALFRRHELGETCQKAWILKRKCTGFGYLAFIYEANVNGDNLHMCL